MCSNMNLKVLEQIDNPLLERKELTVQIENQGSTPTRQELIEKLSASLDAKKELIVIKTIKQRFGLDESTAFVKIYKTEAALKAIEPKPKEKAGKKAEDTSVPDASGQMKVDLSEEPKEEKQEGEAKDEAPAEEKKEEPSEEEQEKKAEEAAGGLSSLFG